METRNQNNKVDVDLENAVLITNSSTSNKTETMKDNTSSAPYEEQVQTNQHTSTPPPAPRYLWGNDEVDKYDDGEMAKKPQTVIKSPKKSRQTSSQKEKHAEIAPVCDELSTQVVEKLDASPAPSNSLNLARKFHTVFESEGFLPEGAKS